MLHSSWLSSPRPAVRPAALALAALLLASPVLPGTASLEAQGVEDQIRSLGGDNAREWVRPIVDGLGGALGTGMFDAAGVQGTLGFNLSIQALVAVPTDVHQRFEVILPAEITWTRSDGSQSSYSNPFQLEEGSTSPTAVGPGEGAVLVPAGNFRNDLVAEGEDPDDFRIRFPSGLDLRAVPAATAQLNVGIGLGTEVSGRYLPTLDVDPEVGGIGLRGWGVSHEVSRWFQFPLDVSVSHSRQDLTAGDILELSTRENWVRVGGSAGPISVFGGGGLRSSNTTLRYEIENPVDRPGLPPGGFQEEIELGTSSSLAWSAGLRLQLLMMNLAAQYVWDDMESFSVRIGIGVP